MAKEIKSAVETLAELEAQEKLQSLKEEAEAHSNRRIRKYTGPVGGFVGGVATKGMKGSDDGTLFLFLALIIFIIDFFGGRYTGFKWIWGIENADVLVNVLTSSIFGTIMLIYILFKVIRRDWAFGYETFSFTFFAIVLTFFILNTQWLANIKAGLHFFYIIFFGLTFMKAHEDDPSTAYTWIGVFLLIDFFGYSLLQNIPVLESLPIILLFSSFYIYQKAQSSISTFFLVGILILMFILAYQEVQATGGDVPFIEEDDKGLSLWERLKKGGGNLVDSWRGVLDIRIQYAITGKVEENQYEPLGVYLENVQTTASRYFIDQVIDDDTGEVVDKYEEVVIWGTVKGRTLDDPINVEVGCFVEKGDDEIRAAKEDPKDKFTIFALEEQDFACTFTEEQLKEGVLKKGFNTISTFADFNFETLAYLKTYFIDRDRLRAMTRDGLDVFDQFEIVDKNPVPVYTNGPVAIEMGTTNPLVGVSKSYIASPRFSLGIRNREGWEGKITGLKELVLLFPKGVVIDNPGIDKNGISTEDRDCNLRFKEYGKRDCEESCQKFVFDDCKMVCIGHDNSNDRENCNDFCEEKFDECTNQCKFLFDDANQQYNGYALDQSEIDKLKEKIYSDEDAERFQRFNCKINPKPSEVLDNNPITTKFFRVKVRYDYRLESPVTVNIVEVPTINRDTEESIPNAQPGEPQDESP